MGIPVVSEVASLGLGAQRSDQAQLIALNRWLCSSRLRTNGAGVVFVVILRAAGIWVTGTETVFAASSALILVSLWSIWTAAGQRFQLGHPKAFLYFQQTADLVAISVILGGDAFPTSAAYFGRSLYLLVIVPTSLMLPAAGLYAAGFSTVAHIVLVLLEPSGSVAQVCSLESAICLFTFFAITQQCLFYADNLRQRTRELAESREQLRVEVQERMRVEAEVRRALGKEKELADLKSRFVSMASHEFRTPLATILAAGEALERYGERMTAAQRSQRISKIRDQVSHMGALLEDVLVLGRAAAGKLQRPKEKVPLKQLCQEVVAEIAETTGAAQRLIADLEQSPEEFETDPTLVRQVLGNLISNAIKYSSPPSCVRFSVESGESGVRLRVEDQGIGIPKRDFVHLFEAFYRGANVGTLAGTGLGLAITKKAVDSLGGRICVDSCEGKGTTVEVLLR